jgi:hypothetical protein
VYLRIIWAPASKVYIKSLDATNPAGVTSNVGNQVAAVPATAGTSYNISNLVLYMATERNQVVENELKDKVMKGGLTFKIPYVWQNKVTINNGTSQSIQVTYNRGHGERLQKIYWAPFTQNETVNNAYNHNNYFYTNGAIDNTGNPTIAAGTNIGNFYTTINQNRTNQFDYNCTLGTDYFIKQKELKGSCIQSSRDYYLNWVWIENFLNNYSLFEKPLPELEENFVDGLDLSVEQNYNIFATTTRNIGFTHYIYAVCQRELSISTSGGIQVR